MPLANRTRAGRRDCGGGAPFCAAQLASLCAMRSRKRPCQPKTAKSIFGGPVPQSPAGQAKERTQILPARRVFSRPACRAMCRAGRLCAACRSCGGFCAWPALFIRSVLCLRGFFLLSFTFSCLTFASQKSFHLSLRPRRALSCLSPPAALFPACGSCHLLLFREPLRPLPVCLFCVVRAGFLPCFSPFPAPLFPLKLLFTCRSGRDGPLLSSEKKVDKDSQKGFAPLNPIPVPCGQSFSLPRCWPA